MYEIKPLEWKVVEHNYPDENKMYESRTSICKFTIKKWLHGEPDDWRYEYCFDEYYDNGGKICKSLQDAKDGCEKVWTDKLKKCLIEI